MKTNVEAVVNPNSLAFRLKVRWFEDILNHPPSRRFLWSLYYAGEAYEELHPDGIFVEKMPEGTPLPRQLARHLSDETRHAEVFRALLAGEGAVPEKLEAAEDVGWYLLNRVVPDVVEASRRPERFERRPLLRYMAFLHALELRSIGDLCALRTAAERRGEEKLAGTLDGILKDERFHATYTHQAVLAHARNATEARDILEQVRKDERKHMSTATRSILRRFSKLGAAPRGLAGSFRWSFMSAMAWLGLAVPLLPHYDRVPARLLPAPQGATA